MKRYVKAFWGYNKPKYKVCYGIDEVYTLGGSPSFDGAKEIAKEQAKETANNPWETSERKRALLKSFVILDTETQENVIDAETKSYIDKLIAGLGLNKNLKQTSKTKTSSEPVLYVIRDSSGKQLSRPNPDDGELWDRVNSMEARGKRGLSVVVYTGG